MAPGPRRPPAPGCRPRLRRPRAAAHRLRGRRAGPAPAGSARGASAAGVRAPLPAPPGGPGAGRAAAARNAGAGASRAELLAFLDSDCTAEPGWLEALVAELGDPAVAAVGGRVLAAREERWLERYEAVRSPLDLGARRAAAQPRQPV